MTQVVIKEIAEDAVSASASKDLALLNCFVACGDPRPFLNKPWCHDGYAYASNGYIMCRIRDNGLGLDYLSDKHGNLVNFFKMLEPLSEFIALPDIKGDVCVRCSGAGKLRCSTCDSCDGDGAFDHCGHDYDCRKCDGDGRLFGILSNSDKLDQCPSCIGSGIKGGAMLIGGNLFNLQYLKIFAQLPAISIAPHPDKSTASCLRWDGGEGLILPMRQ